MWPQTHCLRGPGMDPAQTISSPRTGYDCMIYIGSDHRGVQLKKKIVAHLKGRKIEDLGPQVETATDYPDMAFLLTKKVVKEGARGILICGSGIGMSIAANRIKGARAALCLSEKMTIGARHHNNANILVLAADLCSEKEHLKMVDAFLEESFDGDTPEGGRHKRRVEKLDKC